MNISYSSELVDQIVQSLNNLSSDVVNSKDDINVFLNVLKDMEKQIFDDLSIIAERIKQYETQLPGLENQVAQAAALMNSFVNVSTPEEMEAYSAIQKGYEAARNALEAVKAALFNAQNQFKQLKEQMEEVISKRLTCEVQIKQAEEYQLQITDTLLSIRKVEENILDYDRGIMDTGLPFLVTPDMRLKYEKEYRTILNNNYLLQGLSPAEALKRSMNDKIPSFEEAYKAAIALQNQGENPAPAAEEVFNSPEEQLYITQYREQLKQEYLRQGMSNEQAQQLSENAMPSLSFEQAKKQLEAGSKQPEATAAPEVFRPNPSSRGVASLSGNVSQVGNIGRTPVYVTEEELYHIARIVNNESTFAAGRDGAVAVAEEIRNRVLQNVGGTTVNSILYNGYEKWSGTISSTVSPEVVEMCRNVFNGTEWYFNDDMVLSHASHQTNDRTHVYQHQSGINGTSPADSFYYPQISRQQTFYRWDHK